MTFWILTAAALDGNQQLAIRFAENVGLWRENQTDAKGGGPSATFFDSFENVQVLPPLGWTNELAEYQALLFTMHMTVVELPDNEYSTFISRINSRSADRSAPVV